MKIEHLAIRWLVVKEVVECGEVKMERVATEENRADFLTNPISSGILLANVRILPSFRWQTAVVHMHVVCLRPETLEHGFAGGYDDYIGATTLATVGALAVYGIVNLVREVYRCASCV